MRQVTCKDEDSFLCSVTFEHEREKIIFTASEAVAAECVEPQFTSLQNQFYEN